MKKYILSMTLAVIALSSCAGNSSRSEESGVRSENTPTTDISTDSSLQTTDSSSDLAPDFTLNDLNGKPLTLSSLRGKYVILDFWGSWCVWCIKGFPQMKEYYQKYAGKFEILGIDCNDPEAKWKAAVEKYELPWLHVYCPRDSNVLDLYEIQGFPTKIIVGPDGKIVKTIIGEDPAFYTFLDKLFK
jgi:thiol-disulfide isomerase/thioredoxin